MNILILDLETTGTDDTNNSIVSIAAKLFDKNRKVVNSFNMNCMDMTSEINLGALKVNRFTIGKLASHKSEKDVIYSFCDWLVELKVEGELVLGGHNPQFDIGFIKSKLKKYNVTGFDQAVSYRVLDTATIGRFLVMAGILPANTKVSLKDLILAFNIPYDSTKAHGAEYDVDLTAQLLFAMVDGLAQLYNGSLNKALTE